MGTNTNYSLSGEHNMCALAGSYVRQKIRNHPTLLYKKFFHLFFVLADFQYATVCGAQTHRGRGPSNRGATVTVSGPDGSGIDWIRNQLDTGTNRLGVWFRLPVCSTIENSMRPNLGGTDSDYASNSTQIQMFLLCNGISPIVNHPS